MKRPIVLITGNWPLLTGIRLANAAPIGLPEDLIGLEPLANATPLENAADGWLEIPYADVPNAHQGKQVMQRLTKAAAEQMVALWNSWRGKLARFFGGAPFYVGHPDCAAMKNEYPDDKSYGWIKDLEATDNGLRVRVDWAPTGKALLANQAYKWWSPFFLCQKTAEIANGLPVYVPVWLQSAGFTNKPRWPLEPLFNSLAGDAAMAAVAGGAESPTTPNPTEGYNPMNLIDRIKGVVGNDNLKTDDDVVSHVTAMHGALSKMRSHLKSRWEAERAVDQALPIPNEADLVESIPALLTRLDGLLTVSRTKADEASAALANAKAAGEAATANLLAFRTAAAAPLAACRT